MKAHLSSAHAWWPLVVALTACSPASPPASAPSPAPPEGTAGSVMPAAASSPAPVLEPPSAPTADLSASEPVAPPSAAPPAPAPRGPVDLPKDTVVLHVGDSMADALGKDLRKELLALGIKNALHAKEATYIPEWAGYTHNFAGLLNQYKPDLVIITVGGNEVAMPDPTVRAADVRKMVEKVGDRPCLWIAAPLWGPHTGILEVIRDNCAPCVYVDTNALIPDLERLDDRVHPTLKERKRWAKFMVRWMRYNLDPDGARPWDFRSELIAPPPTEQADGAS